MSKRSVFCIATTSAQAEEIVHALKRENFPSSEISALFADKDLTQDFAEDEHTKAPEGAAAGISAGTVFGGGLGWMLGIGALVIPGAGPFIAAGPLMAALGGAALGASMGGIAGGLIGLGIPEHHAKRYEGEIKNGKVLISVHVDNEDDIARAQTIFANAGAIDTCTGLVAAVPIGDTGGVAADEPTARLYTQ